MILNRICTTEEYMKQGFTEKEIPMIKRSDELFNRKQLIGQTKEEEEYYKLVEILKIQQKTLDKQKSMCYNKYR